MDFEKIKSGVVQILDGIGENLNREGLIETPERVAKMICECLRYSGKSNEEIANEFNVCFIDGAERFDASDQIIVIRDIPAFSYCEHHMALIYDMSVTVAYRQAGKVIGLSKVARIVDAVTSRLQVQERIGEDIIDVLHRVTDSFDIGVMIEAKHSCMAARGIKKDCRTRTFSCIGNITRSDLV